MCDLIKRKQIYLIFIVATLFIACKSSSRPNISHIQLESPIARFDMDMLQHKDQAPASTNLFLEKKYGRFYDDYMHLMLGEAGMDKTEMLRNLFQDPAYLDLSAEVKKVYPNMQAYEKPINEAFKYIKYYYPKTKVPRLVAFVSGFAYQTPIGEGYLGIGLDMFLGQDNPFYLGIVESVPRYMSKRFTPQHLVPRVMESFVNEELFPESNKQNTLLAKMVYRGKLLYFLENILPENTADSLIIGYSAEQMGWATHFEPEIWAYLMEQNLLFETNYQKIQVLLSEGPFTPGLGEERESAPKLGVFTGWQIVRKFMRENPQTSMQELMQMEDAQLILSRSKYKPK